MEEIIQKISNISAKQKLVLVAIDGYGGSGKSTVSKQLKDKLPHITIVQMDDFYSPSLKRPDLKRLQEQVLVPLRNNEQARYQIYKWEKDTLSEWIDIEPSGCIIIEGVFSMNQQLIENYDYKIWVDCSPDKASERGIKRDQEEHGVDTRDKWLREWLPREKEYIEKENPQGEADVIIDGEK